MILRNFLNFQMDLPFYYIAHEIWDLPSLKEGKVKGTVAQSCPTLSDPYGLYGPWNFPGQNTGVGSLSILQGLFPTQG